jgi:hypothetical protein
MLLSAATGLSAKLGLALRSAATQLVKRGGSVGMIAGCPGLCAAWPLAATRSQWLNCALVIGVPATIATAPGGTVSVGVVVVADRALGVDWVVEAADAADWALVVPHAATPSSIATITPTMPARRTGSGAGTGLAGAQQALAQLLL